MTQRLCGVLALLALVTVSVGIPDNVDANLTFQQRVLLQQDSLPACECPAKPKWLFVTQAESVTVTKAPGGNDLDLELRGVFNWSTMFASSPYPISTSTWTDSLLSGAMHGTAQPEMAIAWPVAGDRTLSAVTFKAISLNDTSSDGDTYRIKVAPMEDVGYLMENTLKVPEGWRVQQGDLSPGTEVLNPLVYIDGSDIGHVRLDENCLCAGQAEEEFNTESPMYVMMSKGGILQPEGSSWRLSLENVHPWTAMYSYGLNHAQFVNSSDALTSTAEDGAPKYLYASWEIPERKMLTMPFEVTSIDFSSQGGNSSINLYLLPVDELAEDQLDMDILRAAELDATNGSSSKSYTSVLNSFHSKGSSLSNPVLFVAKGQTYVNAMSEDASAASGILSTAWHNSMFYVAVPLLASWLFL
ncbi:hypothetical protein M9435_003638 [Picochlorum sp. BPE23]|nr:hypothetical protein M9435_003638 [Picochlorum sp. BPE23]